MVTPPPRPHLTLKRRPKTEEASRPPPRKGHQNPQSEQPSSTPPPDHLAHHQPQQGKPPPHVELEPSDTGDAPEAGFADTIFEAEAETPAPASSGKCTSATTAVCNIPGTTLPPPEDPQSPNSLTSPHA
nr:predicted GPI-anchored protein 58 [Procambarus clarkii]